jgi:AraC-like DNA-binding protein
LRDAATSDSDPLARALARKAASGAPGAAVSRTAASGAGWTVQDIVCTSGPADRPFEERQAATSISLVLSGTFVYRSDRGLSLMSSGALLLGNARDGFECSHQHGEGDRCLSFQFEPDAFEELTRDTGVARAGFARSSLPPLKTLAPLTARATAALADGQGDLEETAYGMAGAALLAARQEPSSASRPNALQLARVAEVLRLLEECTNDRHTIAGLARMAGISPYHFLRTFKLVTGVTPHQWLLRARLQAAARRLAAGRERITDIALDVGFEDLSNFVRSFRAEFGVSPRAYRATA